MRIGGLLTGREVVRKYRAAQKESVACPLCGSGPELHRVVLTDDIFSMRLRTVICQRCALVFTNPRPTAEVLERFYRADYPVLYNEVSIPDETYVRRRGFDRAAAFRVKYYEPFLGNHMKLLDIGSGTGAFLGALKRCHPGALLTGIEPSASFARFARETSGADVRQAFLEGVPLPGSGFDAASMFHVLEHLLDPHAALSRVRDALVPGGVLLLEVPNVLGSWRGIGMFHIAHTCAYSPGTLARMVSASGFDVERIDDRDYPCLESAIFLVARRHERAGTVVDEAAATSQEVEQSIRWICSRSKGATFHRFRKATLLELRALRRRISVLTSRDLRESEAREN